jgi:hypothetical protein
MPKGQSMHTIAIESENIESFNKIKWLLEHFKDDGINLVDEEDFRDLQIIKEARKERDAVPLNEFFKSIEDEG